MNDNVIRYIQSELASLGGRITALSGMLAAEIAGSPFPDAKVSDHWTLTRADGVVVTEANGSDTTADLVAGRTKVTITDFWLGYAPAHGLDPSMGGANNVLTGSPLIAASSDRQDATYDELVSEFLRNQAAAKPSGDEWGGGSSVNQGNRRPHVDPAVDPATPAPGSDETL